jgi:hypothetical protein
MFPKSICVKGICHYGGTIGRWWSLLHLLGGHWGCIFIGDCVSGLFLPVSLFCFLVHEVRSLRSLWCTILPQAQSHGATQYWTGTSKTGAKINIFSLWINCLKYFFLLWWKPTNTSVNSVFPPIITHFGNKWNFVRHFFLGRFCSFPISQNSVFSPEHNVMEWREPGLECLPHRVWWTGLCVNLERFWCPFVWLNPTLDTEKTFCRYSQHLWSVDFKLCEWPSFSQLKALTGKKDLGLFVYIYIYTHPIDNFGMGPKSKYKFIMFHVYFIYIHSLKYF